MNHSLVVINSILFNAGFKEEHWFDLSRPSTPPPTTLENVRSPPLRSISGPATALH